MKICSSTLSFSTGDNITPIPIIVNEKALIASGSVVNKNVPSETLVMGDPSRERISIYHLRCPFGMVDRPYKKDKPEEKERHNPPVSIPTGLIDQKITREEEPQGEA
jgi:hypothetical protein